MLLVIVHLPFIFIIVLVVPGIVLPHSFLSLHYSFSLHLMTAVVPFIPWFFRRFLEFPQPIDHGVGA
jgi:hypothetical protein